MPTASIESKRPPRCNEHEMVGSYLEINTPAVLSIVMRCKQYQATIIALDEPTDTVGGSHPLLARLQVVPLDLGGLDRSDDHCCTGCLFESEWNGNVTGNVTV